MIPIATWNKCCMRDNARGCLVASERYTAAACTGGSALRSLYYVLAAKFHRSRAKLSLQVLAQH